MKTIDLTKYKEVYATGDIHGLFRMLVSSLTVQNGLCDSVVVVCGDIGMGFYKRGYYTDEFRWMQSRLEKQNVTVIMFRGNHDNPEYFDNPEYGEFQWFGDCKYKNAYLIPDYTVLKTNSGNVLCAGGAVSIDRSVRTENISWWRDEKFQMPDELDYLEIASEGISMVATHTCPKCCGPLFNNAMGYENADPMLMCELQNERLDLLEVFENLRRDSDGEDRGTNPIKLWLYGHFHGHYSDDVLGTRFVGLDMLRQKGGADLYPICLRND